MNSDIAQTAAPNGIQRISERKLAAILKITAPSGMSAEKNQTRHMAEAYSQRHSAVSREKAPFT